MIRRSETYEHRYQLRGYAAGGRVFPQFETPPSPGTYRLAWDAYETRTPYSTEGGLGRKLPLSARLSNEFRVAE